MSMRQKILCIANCCVSNSRDSSAQQDFETTHGKINFDYASHFEPLRERFRARATEVCAGAGIEVEHVNKSHIRKEDLVQRVLAER